MPKLQSLTYYELKSLLDGIEGYQMSSIRLSKKSVRQLMARLAVDTTNRVAMLQRNASPRTVSAAGHS